MMEYEWDDAKHAENVRKHGVSFDDMPRFEWEFAFGPDMQYVDGEERELWLGPIGTTLFAVVITMRGERTRIVSLRGASRHEKRRWRAEFHDE